MGSFSYYFLVDLRKILRINVKIVAIFIQHPVILLTRTAQEHQPMSCHYATICYPGQL